MVSRVSELFCLKKTVRFNCLIELHLVLFTNALFVRLLFFGVVEHSESS